MILKIIIFVDHQANTIMFVMDRHHRLNLRYVKDIRLGKSCCAFNWEILDLKQKKGKKLDFRVGFIFINVIFTMAKYLKIFKNEYI